MLYRHSTAHLLAAAVTALFPAVQCGIGPPTDEGFFYDFVVPRPFVPEDLEAIEARRCASSPRRPTSSSSVRCGRATKRSAFFGARGEPLKVQLIDEKTEGQSEVSVYTIKDKDTFVDFCVGPHVPSSGRLKAFKLLTTSNAYWKGDARNQPMQRAVRHRVPHREGAGRITSSGSRKPRLRDHRKIGKDQKLFMFHPWAPGATFWLPKGTILYNTLADYMREVLVPAGYTEVKAPIVFNKALWETSGHWQHYRQNMFLVESEGEQMGAQGHELPRPHADVRQRDPQLQGPADPLPRADAAPPQRGVRRAVGPDPRAPVRAGRRPLLRHPGPDRQRGRARAPAGPAGL